MESGARDAQPVVPKVEPPFKAVITEIDSEAQVRDDVLHVTATLKIDLLGQGWIEVPLRLGDAALLSATVGDQPARVVTDEQGGHKLLWNRTEADRPDSAQAAIRAEHHEGTCAEFRRIPGTAGAGESLADSRAAGRRESKRASAAGGHGSAGRRGTRGRAGAPDTGGAQPASPAETVVLAFLGAAPSVASIGRRGPKARPDWMHWSACRPNRRSRSTKGSRHMRVRLNYQISRAELAELKIEVPGDQKVVNVADANLRQWNVEPSGSNQTITVGLFQPARSAGFAD